jgi:hypothetical protein
MHGALLNMNDLASAVQALVNLGRRDLAAKLGLAIPASIP